MKLLVITILYTTLLSVAFERSNKRINATLGVIERKLFFKSQK